MYIMLRYKIWVIPKVPSYTAKINHFYSLRWDIVDVENWKIALHRQKNKIKTRKKKFNDFGQQEKKKKKKAKIPRNRKVENNTFYAEMAAIE